MNKLSIEFMSFVLPAYNEEQIIESTLSKLNSNFSTKETPYEIVVIDDGSKDNTRNKALCYSTLNSQVKVLGYNKNEGKGYAITQGFKESKGDAIILFDSDSDIDPRQIQYFLDLLKKGDIVIGCKWHPKSVVKMPFMRRLLSHSFNFLTQLLTGLKVKDTQTGIKVLRRDAFADLFSQLCVKRYAFDVELLVLAKIYGLKIIEVPVNLTINHSFSFKNIWHMFIDLLGITYRLRIKKWYQRGLT